MSADAAVSKTSQNRWKLSVMMFLQYAIWGAWVVSMGGYMGTTLGFTGVQIGAIYSTNAIGAMISPLFLGIIADKFLATEKMIAILHLAGAALLYLAAGTQDFDTLYILMLVYSICYMPTLALTNSISFANIDDPEADFPSIRVFGTLGWIAVGLLVGFVLDIPPGTHTTPILLAAASSAALGLFSFALPHTPPGSREHAAAETSTGRLGVLQLLGDPSFFVFVVASFLICIPLSFYYSQANVFLTQIDAPYVTALQTIGQMSEVLFMATMPFFIKRLGVKKMLAVGMAAWVVRYFAFGTLQFPLIVVGLVLHGICYDFFFVASQIYVDTRVDKRQRASAQSFIAFVTMGVGMFVGNYAAGFVVDKYPPDVLVDVTYRAGPEAEPTESQRPLPYWDPSGTSGLAEQLGITGESELNAELVTADFVDANEATGEATTYAAASLRAGINEADTDDSGGTTRAEWRLAKRNGWFSIWLWPALAALATLIVFWIGFRPPHDSEQEHRMAEEAPLGSGEGPEPQVM